jgi:hypothetical protein
MMDSASLIEEERKEFGEVVLSLKRHSTNITLIGIWTMESGGASPLLFVRLHA